MQSHHPSSACGMIILISDINSYLAVTAVQVIVFQFCIINKWKEETALRTLLNINVKKFI